MAESYTGLNAAQAKEMYAELERQYGEFQARNLNLDMSRGKPCPAQLDLSDALLEEASAGFKSESGVDARNYGELAGLPEAKELFAELLGCKAESIVVAGNSSLNQMYDVISMGMHFGMADSEKPWSQVADRKFLCPVPGYDRHFRVTEHFGFELMPVKMRADGPDMDEVERLAAADPAVKGIWCVPVFSNPSGAVYSDETVRRLASMQCAAPDFTVMFDNAYCVHSLYEEPSVLPDLLAECEKAGHPNRAFLFASTSKITYSGAGVACVAAGKGSLDAYKKVLAVQTIGFDKVNQLLHARFLKNKAQVLEHMKKHAEILAPKFRLVDEVLTKELGGLGIAEWTKPRGGYFINFTAQPGTAKRIVALCAAANVKLTPAGAAFPYGVEPEDSQIRIAPSYPTCDELRTACELLCLCTKMAVLEQAM